MSVAALVGMTVGPAIVMYSIYSGVKTTCLRAKAAHPGDCMSALTAYIQSDTHTFRERNKALWALGQLADKKALPFLQELEASYAMVNKCDHNTQVCPDEIYKAIKWSKKGNLTHYMYKNREQWGN